MRKIVFTAFIVFASAICNAQSLKSSLFSSQNFNSYVGNLNMQITSVKKDIGVLVTKRTNNADMSKSSVQKSYIKGITEKFIPGSQVRIYWRSAKSIDKNGRCSTMDLEDFLSKVAKDKIIVLGTDSVGIPIWNEELANRKEIESPTSYTYYWAQSKMVPLKPLKRKEFAFKKGDVNDIRKNSISRDLQIKRVQEAGVWRWLPVFGTLVVHCQ